MPIGHVHASLRVTSQEADNMETPTTIDTLQSTTGKHKIVSVVKLSFINEILEQLQ